MKMGRLERDGKVRERKGGAHLGMQRRGKKERNGRHEKREEDEGREGGGKRKELLHKVPTTVLLAMKRQMQMDRKEAMT